MSKEENMVWFIIYILRSLRPIMLPMNQLIKVYPFDTIKVICFPFFRTILIHIRTYRKNCIKNMFTEAHLEMPLKKKTTFKVKMRSYIKFWPTGHLTVWQNKKGQKADFASVFAKTLYLLPCLVLLFLAQSNLTKAWWEVTRMFAIQAAKRKSNSKKKPKMVLGVCVS